MTWSMLGVHFARLVLVALGTLPIKRTMQFERVALTLQTLLPELDISPRIFRKSRIIYLWTNTYSIDIEGMNESDDLILT